RMCGLASMYPAFDLERAMLPAIMDISARAISLAVALVAGGHTAATPRRVHPRMKLRPLQEGTWKNPAFFACDLLNTPIASGVGCNSTLQPFFAKYASASGDRCTLPIWPEPRMSCSHPLSKTNFASSFERTCEVP